MQEMQETQIQSLGREDPLEEGMVIFSLFLKQADACPGGWTYSLLIPLPKYLFT